jgi:hypothetical protein
VILAHQIHPCQVVVGFREAFHRLLQALWLGLRHPPSRAAFSLGENRTKTEIDAGLAQELRARACEQRRAEAELLEGIVRSYLVLAPRRSNRVGGLC